MWVNISFAYILKSVLFFAWIYLKSADMACCRKWTWTIKFSVIWNAVKDSTSAEFPKPFGRCTDKAKKRFNIWKICSGDANLMLSGYIVILEYADPDWTQTSFIRRNRKKKSLWFFLSKLYCNHFIMPSLWWKEKQFR